MKDQIVFEDFAKIDLRVGRVTNCEKKEGSEKLLRLSVDFGEEGTKNILSGIAAWYEPQDLIDKLFIFVLNLEPRKMMGEFSEGMILAAEGTDKPIPLIPSEDCLPGTSIR
jgi:methionyl-tRNA synthetase